MSGIESLLELERAAEAMETKKQRKMNLGYYGQANLSIKELTKRKVLKKIDKDELVEELGGNMEDLTKEIKKFYKNNESKIFGDKQELVEFMTNRKIVAALKTLAKEGQLNDVVLYAISDVIMNYATSSNDEDSSEAIKRLMKVFSIPHDSDVKKLAKTIKCDADTALKLILTSQTYEGCPVRIYRQQLHTFLAYLSECECAMGSKKFKKAIKLIFDDYNRFLVYGLLDTKHKLTESGQDTLDTMTEYMLQDVESEGKLKRKQLVKQVAKKKHSLRLKAENLRINLPSLDEEVYPGILKAIERHKEWK